MTVSGAARTIAVTGASGMIGRRLCDRFRREGWVVRALMRNVDAYPFTEDGVARFHLRLPDEIDEASFAGVDVVVHAAHAISGAPASALRLVNETGAGRVISRARTAGARVVFISTFSAASDARSDYAESKRAIERMLDPARDLIVRPGFVLAADGGMVRRLWNAITTLHAVPIFRGGAQIVQTIHVDDLCAIVARAITSGLAGAVNAAEAEGLTMRDLLRHMARAVQTTCVLVPLPAAPTLALLRLAERLHLEVPLTSDNVLGLLSLRRIDTTADLARVGVRLRTARESIAELAALVRGH